MKEDIERWDKKFHGRKINDHPLPDSLLVESPWLPNRGSAIDIAAGSGQNAVYLALAGLNVTAVDGSAKGLELCRRLAEHCGVEVNCVQMDLDFETPIGTYDLVLVMHYLNRDLFRELPALMNPGGLLMVKTFNEDFLRIKTGFDPAYTLAPGELPELFAGLDILEHRESPPDAPGKSHLIAKSPF